MGEVVYRSEVRLERRANGVRPATIPGEAEPVLFGSHGPIAAHYGYAGDETHATTLDYVVAAACG